MSDLAKLAVGSVSDASRIGKSREKLLRVRPEPNPRGKAPRSDWDLPARNADLR